MPNLTAIGHATHLVETFGGSLPASVVEAHRKVVDLTRQRRTARTTPISELAARALDSADTIEKASANAAKVRSGETARVDLLDAMIEEATRRANAAVYASAAEIADSVLGGTVLADAFATIAETAPKTHPKTPHDPIFEKDGADAVVNAATLKKAVAVFSDAVVRLDVLAPLGVSYDAPGVIDGSEVDEVAGLACFAVDYSVADYRKVRAALRNVDGNPGMVTMYDAGYLGGMRMRPLGTHRLAPAMLAAMPGVTLSHATTYAELARRAEAFAHASRPTRS